MSGVTANCSIMRENEGDDESINSVDVAHALSRAAPALVPTLGWQPCATSGGDSRRISLRPGTEPDTRQRCIAARQLAQERTHRRLVAAHQFAERVGVPGLQDARNQVGVGEAHGLTLCRLLA